MNKTIATQNLYFKPISRNDVDEVYEAFIESFENITSYYRPAWSRYEDIPPKREIIQFITEQVKQFECDEGYMFSVFDIKDNNFIGLAELHSIDHSVPKARLGYWVRDRKFGNGYATEMAVTMSRIGFDVLKCQRLEIRNDVRNQASGKIARKIGYEFLTIFEKNKQGKPGDFWNLEIYACLSRNKLPEMDVKYYDQS